MEPAGNSSGLVWRFGRRGEVVLDRPLVMAILNVTPDSFHDGGRLGSVEAVVEAARRAVEAGAGALDIGGESTRPGAASVGENEQILRTAPAVRAIREAGIGCVISVDTTRAAVARACLEAGADAINDVSAGTDDAEMLRVAGGEGAGLIVMHRLVKPDRDRYSDAYVAAPVYGDVAAVVGAFLKERCEAARAAGVAEASVCVDPGLGFGKSVEQNLELIRRTGEIGAACGRPVVSALSRKSFVGRVSLGRESTPEERLGGTVGMSVVHYVRGARVFRVHDVREHVEALEAARRVHESGV